MQDGEAEPGPEIEQAGQQPDDGTALAFVADGIDRAGNEVAAGDHQQGDRGAGDDRQALGAFVESLRKMRPGDEIHGEQHRKLDELAGDASPDPLVAGDAAGFWLGGGSLVECGGGDHGVRVGGGQSLSRRPVPG